MANQGRVRLGIYLLLVSVFFMFWFLGYLRQRMAEAEGERPWITSAGFAGGVVWAALWLVVAIINLAGSVPTDYEQDPQVAKTLYTITWVYGGVFGPAVGAFVGATSLVGLRFKALPGWLN